LKGFCDSSKCILKAAAVDFQPLHFFILFNTKVFGKYNPSCDKKHNRMHDKNLELTLKKWHL